MPGEPLTPVRWREKAKGAALLKGLLTSSFAGLSADRRLGLLPSCTGEGDLNGVGDRGAQAAEAAAQGGNARGSPSRARASKANRVTRRSARAGHRGGKPLQCPVTSCPYAVAHAIVVRGRCGGLSGDGG